MLTEMWYKNRKIDTKEERKRLVQIVGKILMEDIGKSTELLTFDFQFFV